MKKGLVFLLLAALVFSPVFAGGSSESSDSGKDQLLWLYESATAEHEQHLRTDLIEVVNSRADDYEFEIRFDPNYDQNVRTQLLAGAGPDLVLTAGPTTYRNSQRKVTFILWMSSPLSMDGMTSSSR